MLILLHIRLSICTQIHSAVQQVGFRRFKRGYKKPSATPIDPAAAIAAAAKEHRDPTDPYFTYQWYLVSEHTHANGISEHEGNSWSFVSIRNQLKPDKQTRATYIGFVRRQLK